jgi:hypothetical protein
MISSRRLFRGQSKSLVGLLAAASALAAACFKAPAETALKAADQAVASASRDGEKFAPEQFKALMEAAKSAHEQFTRGDYAVSKASAETLVTDAQEVVKAAAAKKQEVTKAWSELQTQVPTMGDAIRAKLDELAAMKKLPKGFDRAQLEEAKAGLAAFDQAWGSAAAAAQSGDVISALEKGRAAHVKALGLVFEVGLPSHAAPQAPAAK